MRAGKPVTSGGLLALVLRRRPAGDLLLFLACQTLAVAIVTGILLFTDRIQQAIYRESANMLAADLVVQSSRLPEAAWQQQADTYPLRQVSSARFASMLFYADQLQLTDIRVVTDGYPLRGELTAAADLYADATPQTGLPQRGEIWLDRRSAETLGASPGDLIEVGESNLRFSMVLHEEPGSALPSMGFSGRALMRMQDLESTALVQPGSRVSYNWMLAGDPGDVSKMREWLEPRLSTHDSLATQEDGDERTQEVLQRATSFLNLGGAIAVLLAGIAAMIAAARYMSGQQDKVAIMRALGAVRSQVLSIYLLQFSLYSLLALLLGYLLGFSIQAAGFQLIREVIDIPANIEGKAFAAGAVTSMFCLLCFALPTLSSLVKVSPMRLLRASSSSAGQGRGILVFAFGFLLLMYYYSGDWRSTLLVYGGIVALGGLVWILVTLITSAMDALLKRRRDLPLWLPLYMGLKAFCRQPQMTQLRTAALAMTITLLAVVVTLRGSLLEDWQMQLPDDAPNYFALNIPAADGDRFASTLDANQVISQPLYPVARARLVAFNGKDYQQWGITDPDTITSLDREMVLTGTDGVPPGNEIVQGVWHGQSLPGSADGLAEVSVEDEYARRLKLSVGDVLTFSFTGQLYDVRVTSLRSLNWNSMQPNFYFVLSRAGIEEFPFTYMTSFHVPPASQQVMKTVIRDFPVATIIDIGLIVSRAQGIIGRASMAVQSVAWITVLAGLLVVVASLRATLDARIREQTISRALGGSSSVLRLSILFELLVTGLVAGVSGMLAASLITGGLGRWIFEMSLQVPLLVWWLLPLASIVLVIIAGQWVLRRVHSQSPLAIWRGQG